MQYILSQEEYNTLLAKQEYQIAISKKKLQTICSDVCDNYIVKSGWYKDKPWGCILTTRKIDWYCDDCPVQDICPYENKRYSK